MISQTLPMAAMFMRNKILSWSALFLAVQSYLNEPLHKPETKDESATQPPLLRVLFALISVFACYVEFIFPLSSPTKRAVQAAATATVAAATATATATAIV